MAATAIIYNNQVDPMRTAARALDLILEGIVLLGNARQVMIALCNGSTGTAADWALAATQCGFQAGGYADANTAAMAAFSQMDTVYQALTLQTGTANAPGAAITQACGQLGVV